MAWTGKASERRARVPGGCLVLLCEQVLGKRQGFELKEQTAGPELPPTRAERPADRTPAPAREPLPGPTGGPAAGSQLLAAAPSSTRPPGRSPSQGKFNWVPWQPKSTRTPQGVVEKSEFDMLGNI